MSFLVHLVSLQYIGCTTRNLRMRINEHIYAVKNNANTTRTKSGASKHFLEIHKGDLTSFPAYGLEQVHRPK